MGRESSKSGNESVVAPRNVISLSLRCGPQQPVSLLNILMEYSPSGCAFLGGFCKTLFCLKKRRVSLAYTFRD